MRRFGWQVPFGLSLVVLCAFLYTLHFAIFRDPHHIFIYMLGDVAFVPLEVLLVIMIVHRLLSNREKRARLEKLNMVIGAFFSEAGTSLLTYFSDFDPNLDEVRKDLIVTGNWSEEQFSGVSERLDNYVYAVDIQKVDLEYMHTFLMRKRDFMLRLLENPSLLEHESFTDLLRAVFHLAEELEARENMKELPRTDLEHLAGDSKRAYALLVHEWLGYMKHLKNNYPYLFSLAMRTNPFDRDSSPLVA